MRALVVLVLLCRVVLADGPSAPRRPLLIAGGMLSAAGLVATALTIGFGAYHGKLVCRDACLWHLDNTTGMAATGALAVGGLVAGASLLGVAVRF
jgi:hypothetical protein